MTSGDLTPKKPQHSKLWWEIRITAGGLALLAMVIGGYQLWEIALKPLSTPVVIQGAPDPSSQGESTAEWLVRRLEFHIHLTETDDDLLMLPAGTLEGTLRVKGHHQRREVEDASVVAVGRLPGAEHSGLQLSLRATSETPGLKFLLSVEQAEAYCRRDVKTYVVIRDQREAAVRGLASVGRIPIRERRDEPGTYDLEVPLENLIFVLEGDGFYPVEVRTPDGTRSTLTVPGEWFLREGQRSRVLTVEQAVEPPPPAPAPTPEPEKTPPPSPPPAAQESPQVKADPLEARLAELEQGIVGAIGRGQWDRAEASIGTLAEAEGPTDRVRRLRDQLKTARAAEQAQQRLQDAIDAVAAALRAKNWDQAETAVGNVRDLAPKEERLATWQEIIDEGRAAERAASEAEAAADAGEEIAAPPPPVQPPVDEGPRVRATLRRYVESQNTLDWNLFVSVYPSIASSRDQIQRAWSGYRSQTVELDVQSVQVTGDGAVARCYRTVSVVPKVGSAQRAEGRYEITLVKADDAWVIEGIQPLR